MNKLLINRAIFRRSVTPRPALLLVILVFASFILAACSDQPTASPANNPVSTPGSTPVATGGTGSGIVVQPGPGGQPLPTPTPPGPDTRKVLTIWTGGWQGNVDNEKFLNDQIDSYRTRDRNMTINWLDFGADLAKKFEEVTTTNPDKLQAPDLVLFNEGDVYQFGALGRLNDIITLGGSGLKDNYVPSTFEALRYGSVYYGLPWVASTQVTIINKKLWQQATLDPAKPPKTYDELEPMIPLMVTKTPQNVTPIWVKPDPLVDFMMEDAPLYTVSGDGKSLQTAFPSAATTAKWQYYEDRSKKLIFDRDGLAKGYADALRKYAAGELIMVMDGAPLLPGLKNSNADLYNNTLVVPHVTGKAGVLPLDLQGWAIPKASKQPAEALAFLKFIETPENQLAFAKSSGLTVPTLKKALTDPYVTSQDEPLSQARSIIAATLATSRPPELTLPSPLRPADRDKLVAALNNAQASIWGKDPSPQAALTEAAKIWNEVLKQRTTI